MKRLAKALAVIGGAFTLAVPICLMAYSLVTPAEGLAKALRGN